MVLYIIKIWNFISLYDTERRTLYLKFDKLQVFMVHYPTIHCEFQAFWELWSLYIIIWYYHLRLFCNRVRGYFLYIHVF